MKNSNLIFGFAIAVTGILCSPVRTNAQSTIEISDALVSVMEQVRRSGIERRIGCQIERRRRRHGPGGGTVGSNR